MPRRSRRSIPHELHQIRAQEIYERRIAKGRNGSSEGDWETARRYLTRYPKSVSAWKRNRAITFYRQLPRSFFRRLARSFKALIGVIWKLLTFPFWLFYKLPQLFANTETRPFALDVVQTIISAASLLAAIIAAIGLFVNYQDALRDRQDALEDRKITQERLVADRFVKAVEQIGNDKKEVVIGGIYSLEKIAEDSPSRYQQTIREVMTAIVRENSPIPLKIQELQNGSDKKSKELEKLDSVNIQTQAALTVIGRRDPEQDCTSNEASEGNTKRLDLRNSNLRNANLRDANLRDANLRDANLRYADFCYADLYDASLRYADLYDAYLRDAYLRNADLYDANLRDAYLRDAYLYDVQNLSNQQIKLACFWDKATYTEAEWNDTKRKWIAADEKANKKWIEEIKQDRASDPENPPDCDQWK